MYREEGNLVVQKNTAERIQEESVSRITLMLKTYCRQRSKIL